MAVQNTKAGRGGPVRRRPQQPPNPPSEEKTNDNIRETEPKIPPYKKTNFVIRATEPKIVLGFMCFTVIYLIAQFLTLYVLLMQNTPSVSKPVPSGSCDCPDVSRLEQDMKDLNGKVENIKGDMLNLRKSVEDQGEPPVNNCDGCVKRNELDNEVADVAVDKSSILNVTITAEITYQMGLVKQEHKREMETVDRKLDKLENEERKNVANLNTSVAEVDKKLSKRIDDVNLKLNEVNLTWSQTIFDVLIEVNSTVSQEIKDTNTALLNVNSTLSQNINDANVVLVDVNTTLSQKVNNVNSTLSQEIHDVNTTLSQRIYGVNTDLTEVNSTLSQRIHNVNVTLSERIFDVNATLSQSVYDVNTTLIEVNSTLSQRIHNVNVTLSERISDVNATLSQRVYDVNTTLTEVNSTLSQRINNVNVTLSQRIYDVNATLMKINSSLSQRILGVNVSLWQRIHELMDTVVGDLSEGLGNASASISDIWFSINLTEKRTYQNFTNLQEDLESFRQFTKKFGTETLYKLLNLSDTTEKNSRDLSNLTVFMWLGFAAVVLFILVSCRRIAKGPDTPMYASDTARKGSAAIKSQPLRSVLGQIHQKSLDKRICILSFYAETQPLHNRLTASACQARNITQIQFLIGRHEDIPNIPPCKIVLVFVDFNERDIILENPKREVGDLKLTTVKGARKMGADVFVIYVRDKGSMSLKDGLLFNPNLRSIYNHEELNDLNNRERVMSTYESFTHFQKQHLERCIRALR